MNAWQTTLLSLAHRLTWLGVLVTLLGAWFVAGQLALIRLLREGEDVAAWRAPAQHGHVG
ncbi:hypothetical protein [Deinococcus sp.]|uniref:hypothetical protein n=1 Tax=Deinococcus sp. TaxID=47478 RepID=UPI00286998C5|nr:hypothetical protein [Deinococcus sp.]